MYIKQLFKSMRSVVPNTIASVGTTAACNITTLNSTTICSLSTVNIFGVNFSATVQCTTGSVYICPGSTIELTSTNSITLIEREAIDIQIETFLAVKGDSTTAAFQAIVWGD